MSTHTHTPAPWIAKWDGFSYLIGYEGNGRTISGLDRPVCRTVDNCAVSEANARLIAAAPELLAALKGCADALHEAGKSFAIHNPHAARPNLFELHEIAAREAIRKAKGA